MNKSPMAKWSKDKVSRRRRLSQFGDLGRRVVTKRIQITLPTQIAIVSDTHSSMHENTIPLLQAMKPELILHAGDIGRLDVIDTLAKVAPVVAVRGNIDALVSDIPDDVIVELEVDGQLVSTWLLTHIAVRGPRLLKPVLTAANNRRWNMVVCGHSHVPLLSQQNGVTVFNPGSVGPRRFQLPIVLGEVLITSHSIRARHLSCETRDVWLPTKRYAS